MSDKPRTLETIMGKNNYCVYYSYVARDRVGGRSISSSAGTHMFVYARGHKWIPQKILAELTRIYKATITELKIIKVG